MNKYLKKLRNLEKELAKEFNENGYDVLAKMQIASEIDCILENFDEFANVKLTNKQQEKIINIADKVYLDLEDDKGFYDIARAVMFTMINDYGTYESFVKNWEEKEHEVWDKIVWRL